MSSFPVIAIDGTAASGKSTVSRQLAARLGYVYVNTGAMYRAVTWQVLASGLAPTDAPAIVAALPQWNFKSWIQDGICHLEIAGVDPEPHVRDDRVNAHVSPVAAIPEVRALLVAQQQALATQAPLVMEGRDIGTVVFPQTPYKFFIDADPAVRAQRRQAQGETDKISARDQQDRARATAPMKKADGAVAIDSGVLSIEEIVQEMLRHLVDQGLTIPSSLAHRS